MTSFFQSPPVPCPYLPGQIEQVILTQLTDDTSGQLHSTLCQAGFRRSQDVVYRPACPTCSACIPIRIKAKDFIFTPRWKRVLKESQDLEITQKPVTATSEVYDLFHAYQQQRHPAGSMAKMTYTDYAKALGSSPVQTYQYEARNKSGQLQAVMLADQIDDGLSAVYCFFDPAHPKRSLGSRMILHLVRTAQQSVWPYVYLGYWIAQSPQMSYKSQFHPFETLTSEGWTSGHYDTR